VKILKEVNQKHKVNSIDNSMLILLTIIGIGFLIRFYYIPFQIPISLDGSDYFIYAVAMYKENLFPTGYLLTNFGWPTFVSMFFFFFQDSEMIHMMNIQRILSIGISVVATIPIYLLCKNFFRKEIAILGASLFLFDPRIIENSILGLPGSLFILFSVLTILFVFHKESKFFYLSFVFVGLAAFVRYEGLILIIPVGIAVLLKYKERKISKKNISLGITLFLIIIIPVNFIGFENEGELHIFTHFAGGGNYFSEHIINEIPDIDDKYFGEDNENRILTFFYNASSNYIKYLGWIMIPILIIFVVVGIIFIKKSITKNKIIFIIFFCFLSIPGLYAYARGIEETKYLLVLIPLLCLLSCYGFDYFRKKYNVRMILLVVISGIIVSSIIFVEYRNQSNIEELEIFQATKFLVQEADGVNNYYGNKYVKIAELENSWPELLPKGQHGKMTFTTEKYPIEGFDNPLEYIELNKDNNLSHLLITKDNKNGFFDDIYINEDNYPFLEKIYDSTKLEMNTKYKIFKINFERLNEYEK
jgi:hypothetical protein